MVEQMVGTNPPIVECLVKNAASLPDLATMCHVSRLFRSFASPKLRQIRSSMVIFLPRREPPPEPDPGLYQERVAVLGEKATGKTCLSTRLHSDSFSEEYVPTVGSVFFTKPVLEGREMAMWDTSGQDMYRPLLPMYYTCANVVILVYDTSNRDNGFAFVQTIAPDVHAKTPAGNIILCGTKCDLPRGPNGVSFEEGYRTAKCVGAVAFVETSAKTGQNVTKLFEAVGKLLAPHQS
ncbi:GTP-binding protein YPT6 [Pelomyxa schiedti]|nr:GTP-binding protein YPT6 [Pelomyxa schiedti]